ncbi:MAG: hypothetical protein M1814_000511 [Vezdaea aestivalis]|nr:MAG: hypothetical protein M1814_000511 [Vezdaea aestivalis]
MHHTAKVYITFKAMNQSQQQPQCSSPQPSTKPKSLELAQTIASFLALLAVLLGILTILNERIHRMRAADLGSFCALPEFLSHFHVSYIGHIAALRGQKTPGVRVPSVKGLIEAGDEGLWTSVVLDNLRTDKTRVGWVPLYEAVFEAVVEYRKREKSKEFGEEVESFLERAEHKLLRQKQVRETTEKALDAEENGLNKRKDTFERRFGQAKVASQEEKDTERALKRDRKKLITRKMANKTHDFYRNNGYLVNCCLKLDMSDEIDDQADSETAGLRDIQITWLVGQTPGIKVTREELVALALTFGIALKWNSHSRTLGGIGAFGTSLDALPGDGTWRLYLERSSRLTRHQRCPGSGYSTIMAKHLACGSLPFAQGSKWVQSIYLKSEILAGIKAGDSVKDTFGFGGESLEYLRSLPASKQTDAFYGRGPRATLEKDLGQILKADDSPVGVRCKWSRAVTGIAFGGLVPQAAERIALAVGFTAAGEKGSAEEELEALVDDLHRLSEQKGVIGVMGLYVADRVDARESIDNVYYTRPERRDSRDAAGVFARYMTLLERVVAECDAAPRGSPGGQLSPAEQVYEAACELMQRVYVLAVRSQNETLKKNEEELLNQHLGKELEKVRGKLNDKQGITPVDCAIVVRCILAAWARQVPYIVWPDGQLSMTAPHSMILAMDDIPPVTVLV